MRDFYSLLNSAFSEVKSEPPLFTTYYKIEGKQGCVKFEHNKIVGVTKPIRQEFYMLVKADMDQIIDWFNEIYPLTEEDYLNVRESIKDHAENQVKLFRLNNPQI